MLCLQTIEQHPLPSFIIVHLLTLPPFLLSFDVSILFTFIFSPSTLTIYRLQLFFLVLFHFIPFVHLILFMPLHLPFSTSPSPLLPSSTPSTFSLSAPLTTLPPYHFHLLLYSLHCFPSSLPVLSFFLRAVLISFSSSSFSFLIHRFRFLCISLHLLHFYFIHCPGSHNCVYKGYKNSQEK